LLYILTKILFSCSALVVFCLDVSGSNLYRDPNSTYLLEAYAEKVS
jgi:hypothetical protein